MTERAGFAADAAGRHAGDPGGGRRELVGGIAAGVVLMVPLAFV